MIKSFTLNNTSDSILSRICLASLIWLLLILGGFSSRAWGRTSSVNTPALWVSSTYSTGDSVVWSAPNVTFKLHNGGNVELYLSDHILIQKNRHYTLEWRVAEGYTINVTQVSVRARGTLQSYITVGTNKSGNIYGQSYTTVNSQALSLGNNGTVDIYPESEDRDDAIIHMDEITVTYTMDGVEKEVTFDGTSTEWGNTNKDWEPTTAFDKSGTHAIFHLSKPMKKKKTEYFHLKEDNTSTLDWTVDEGYTISVSAISMRATNEWWGSRGKGFVNVNGNTSATGREIKLYENSSTVEKSCSVDDEGTDENGKKKKLLFGNPPTALGNTDCFKLYATSATWNIYWITLTYTINPNSYDINLNNESPTTSGSTSVTVTYDANSQLSITNPTKYGYTFDGWYSGETDGNGSGTEIIDVDGNLQADKTVGGTVYTGAEGVWKKTTATTLYAKWILNSDKTITLSNQSATIAGTASITVRYNTNGYSKNPIDVPAKTGYTFDGYYSAISGGVQIIDAGGNVVASAEGYTDSSKNWINGDEETTLYAHWTGVPYSVRFNGTEKTAGSMSNQDFVYGTAQNLTANAFEKTCMVTYDANGGSCGIASSETPFSFLGWATSEEGAVVYSDGAEEGNLATVEGAIVDLYAKWSATADAVELPMPTKDDCVFAGWYNLSDEKIGDAGRLYSPSGNITLKAHWRLGAASKNSDDDISSNSIIMNGPHATFTFSGETNITDFREQASWPPLTGKPEGYILVQAFDKNDNDGKKNYSISWASTNANCSIQVTKISFWVKAYNSNADNHEKAKVAFAGDTLTVGTAALTANEGDYRKFSKATTFAGSSVDIVCINNTENDFDYYIKNISIEYEVYTTAPSPTDGVQQVNVTINVDAKQTVDLSSLFTYAVTPPSDFTYTYEIVGSPASADLQGGTNFWASVSGDYSVRAKVATAEDHHGSEWSSTKTIRVKRVPYIFNNSQKDEAWATTSNWNASWLPTSEDSVIIRGDLVIDDQITVAKFSIENEAIVNIAPTGGLTVGAGGISGATTAKLILKAQAIDDDVKGVKKGQTGYIRFSPDYEGEMPEASVEMYSVGYKDVLGDSGKDFWQYVGVPIDKADYAAKDAFPKSMVYSWQESTGTWVNNRSKLKLKPFVGYATSQYRNTDGYMITFFGNLANNRGTKTVDLVYTDGEGELNERDLKGWNVVANSYAAPIDITRFTTDDFGDADATIHIWDTRSKNFISIAVASLADLPEEVQRVIPSMQAFFVHTDAATTMTFNYERLVWNGTQDNKPMKAPQRTQESDLTGRMSIRLLDGEDVDNLYLLEKDAYERSYENGFDAPKKFAEDKSAIYAVEDGRDLAIDATNSIIGTRVGVRTGKETAYTLLFSHVDSEDELALYDSETEQTIDINEGTQYTFFAEPNAMITERFEIVARADVPAITTGVDNVENGAKVHKFIKGNQLFILKNGVLYNATGAVVR